MESLQLLLLPQVHKNTLGKWIAAIVSISILVVIYKYFNPYHYEFFPKCPVKTFTGYDCAGCGSQRAIHYLLNFEIYNAARENMLLVAFLPYILGGFILDSFETLTPNLLKWRKALYGTTAIWIVLMIILAFWVLRNLAW